MPIVFPYEYEQIQSSVVLKKSLYGNDADWIVWWYCGINKNIRVNSQPHVLVAFRRIFGNQVGDIIFFRKVLLTCLGSLRIGSVWRNGRCSKIARFEERTFEVNFTNKYKHVSFATVDNQGLVYQPFDQTLYPLKYTKDQNKLLQFQSKTGELVSIPSLEFYSRMYGASEEVKRVIATYDREECKKRFFREIRAPTDDNVWTISRRKKYRKHDNVFLAHFKYDSTAKKACRRIHAQIEAAYDGNDETHRPIFIEVDPWFLGKTHLTVRGVSCDNGNTFLGLQIMGYDLPMGPRVVSLLKKNDGQLEEEQLGENSGRGRVKLELITPPEEAHITDDSEPNQGGSIAELKNLELKIRNPGREIIEVDVPTQGSNSSDWHEDIESSLFSTGEPIGTGGDIGHASIHTPFIFESKGKLRDVWEALLYLKKANDEKISSVDWFTIKNGFSNDNNFQLIKLKAFEDDDQVQSGARNWVYLNAKKKKQKRGALIIRVMVNGLPIYFVEIQRRIISTYDENGHATIGEESMTGLVFVLDDQTRLESWIKLLLAEIRFAKGVFKKIRHLCPGEADFFKHSKAEIQAVPEEASVKNALRKMGVSV